MKKQSIVLFCSNEQYTDYKSARAWAEFHLKKAIDINPNYLEAYLNYGNFLKVFRKQIEEGNLYYRKLKEIDKNGVYKQIIDVLIKSDKG